MSALKQRWYEQTLLVREEMKRTVRFFKYYERHWCAIADEAINEGRAAYARKYVCRTH